MTTEYTPKQLRLIEQYRDCNVDHDWWDSTIEDFINAAKEFGITVHRDDVQFSGFWSQGDGASFTFSSANAYDVIMAALNVEQTKPFGAEPGGYAAEFAALGKLLLDTFSPYVLTCPEGRELAESYTFEAKRISHHYSHSNTVSVGAECGFDLYGLDDDNPKDCARRDVWNALCTKIFGKDAKLKHEREPSLEDELDDAVKAIADALYSVLEDEYNYLTEDDQVWDTIVANEWDEDEDEDEDEEDLAEAA